MEHFSLGLDLSYFPFMYAAILNILNFKRLIAVFCEIHICKKMSLMSFTNTKEKGFTAITF